MNDSEDDTTLWLKQLAAGDPDAADRFWRQYAIPLERLASGRLSPALQRRVGAEDILQSVCRTFFRRSRSGEYELTEPEQLWRLLCAITVNKVHQCARFHFRQRRGIQFERNDLSQSNDSVDSPVERAESPEGSVEEAVAFVDQMEVFLSSLGEEERQLIQYRLDGLSHREIADKMNCTERTVRRIVAFVRNRWEKSLDQVP